VRTNLRFARLEATTVQRAERAVRSWVWPERTLLRQFLQFSGVGALGTAVQYLVLIALVSGCSLPNVRAAVAAFLAGASVNYVLNYRWTFRSRKTHRETAAKFLMVALVGLLFTAGIMAVLGDGLGLHYLWAQGVATGCVLLWTFSCNRQWTFRERQD